MKKIIIFIFVILGLISVPFLGNKVIQDTIEQRLSQFRSDGLAVQLLQEKKQYLVTKLVYSIKVSDEQKFISFLQQYSSKQLPPYTKSLLDGVEFGVELQYNNVPLSDKIDIDIYPIKLPQNLIRQLTENDQKLYQKIDRIIKEKKILYHITYAVTSGEFSGYMKDFNESFEQIQGNKVAVKYRNVIAHGKGFLLAPENLKISVGEINASVKSDGGMFDLVLKDLYSSSNFESDTTYITSLKLNSMKLLAKDRYGKNVIDTDIKELGGNFSSNTQNKDAEIFAKGVVEEFLLKNAQGITYKAEGFQYDIQIDGLNKKSYIKLKEIFEKVQLSSVVRQPEAQKEIFKIISHGFNLKVAKFSLKNFIENLHNDLGGFDINLILHVNKDPNFLQHFQHNPLSLTKNITFHTDLRFDREFYIYLNTVYGIENIIGSYKKEQNNQVFFDIDYIDQELYINKQKVQK